MNRPSLGRHPTVLGSLGYSSSQWAPRDYNYYARQMATQAGAWAGPEEDKLDCDVRQVVEAFKTRGTKAGCMEARKRNLLVGARLYLDVRADTEEKLSARLADLKADLIRDPDKLDAQRIAFVEARLEDVRKSIKAGHTPSQAVADKPEIPRKEVPSWIPKVAIGLSIIAFLRSL